MFFWYYMSFSEPFSELFGEYFQKLVAPPIMVDGMCPCLSDGDRDGNKMAAFPVARRPIFSLLLYHHKCVDICINL